VTTTAMSRPRVSTSRCRLRPFTFFQLSNPLVAAGTTPSADSCTDWESMIAADGSG
jgi:hypothetical protein